MLQLSSSSNVTKKLGKSVKKSGKREHHLWKRKESAGSGQKAMNLVRIVSGLSNEKEAVYRTLDEWIAWELEFPMLAVAKALRILKNQSHLNKPFKNFFPREVTINVYVLGALMEDRVLGYVNGTLVVTMKCDRLQIRNTKLTHVTSAAAEAIALYSDSEDDLDTVGCFLDFQLMGEEPSCNT
uniref:Uncharacterized protein n=1 Tax=Chenopodium quinoa TaxID=63459 RepID=A0A803MVA3_CHEQI